MSSNPTFKNGKSLRILSIINISKPEQKKQPKLYEHGAYFSFAMLNQKLLDLFLTLPAERFGNHGEFFQGVKLKNSQSAVCLPRLNSLIPNNAMKHRNESDLLFKNLKDKTFKPFRRPTKKHSMFELSPVKQGIRKDIPFTTEKKELQRRRSTKIILKSKEQMNNSIFLRELVFRNSNAQKRCIKINCK